MPDDHAKTEWQRYGCEKEHEALPQIEVHGRGGIDEGQRGLSRERGKKSRREREQAGQDRGQSEIGAGEARKNGHDRSKRRGGEQQHRDRNLAFDPEALRGRDGKRGHDDEIGEQKRDKARTPERGPDLDEREPQPDRPEQPDESGTSQDLNGALDASHAGVRYTSGGEATRNTGERFRGNSFFYCVRLKSHSRRSQPQKDIRMSRSTAWCVYEIAAWRSARL